LFCACENEKTFSVNSIIEEEKCRPLTTTTTTKATAMA
jgi:hypothetical protein